MSFTSDQINYIKTEIDKLASTAARENKRNIKELFEVTKNDLFDAAYSITNHPEPHIVLTTGFYIPGSGVSGAETDGPIGTAHLAKGLINAGVTVSIITDTLCVNAVKAALQAVNIEQFIPIQQIPVNLKEIEYDKIMSNIIENWKDEKPPVSHIISIERPGTAYDGQIYNMNGENISKYTVALDKLFSNNHKVTRIAIGDGGNEIGMGKLSHKIISENIVYGSIIACSTSCDHLIVSGISNWGCYALLASIALLSPQKSKDIMHNFSLRYDHDILLATVNQGEAIDGVTAVKSLSVDGLSWEQNAKLLEEILEIANSAIMHISAWN